MSKYREAAAAFKIDGYLIPSPDKDRYASFKSAKAELIDHLKKDIETIKEMNLDAFLRWKNLGFNPEHKET